MTSQDSDPPYRLRRAVARLEAYAATRDNRSRALVGHIQESAVALIRRSAPIADMGPRVSAEQLLTVAKKIEDYLNHQARQVQAASAVDPLAKASARREASARPQAV